MRHNVLLSNPSGFNRFASQSSIFQLTSPEYHWEALSFSTQHTSTFYLKSFSWVAELLNSLWKWINVCVFCEFISPTNFWDNFCSTPVNIKLVSRSIKKLWSASYRFVDCGKWKPNNNNKVAVRANKCQWNQIFHLWTQMNFFQKMFSVSGLQSAECRDCIC